jgi:hypothetical protein
MTPGERGAIQRIVREAKAAGFLVYSVFDGEEHQRHPNWTKDNPVPMTEPQVCDACASVDESHIHFQHRTPGGVGGAASVRKGWAWIILGNAEDGSELPADNSCGDPDFAAAMDRVCKD